jgi:hypothetical protein
MHYAAISALAINMHTGTRAVGPGYYIEPFGMKPDYLLLKRE